MTISINASADGTQASIATSGTNALSFGAGIQQGNKNVIINGDFRVNQRAYVSGAAVGANLYAHDRWKMAASGDTYTYTTTNNVTTITIPAGKVLQQVVEGVNLQSGTYTLSWIGTAQGKIGAGAYGNSGVTGVVVGGVDTTIEFGPGTVSRVQLEFGNTATPFEIRLYSNEQALCQRYYCRTFSQYSGVCTSTTAAIIAVNFPIPMRANPILLSTITLGVLVQAAGGTTAINSISSPNMSSMGSTYLASVTSGMVAGNSTIHLSGVNQWTAEL